MTIVTILNKNIVLERNKMELINQIKSILIIIVMSVVGLFVWKTKNENENLKEDLASVKETINSNSIETERQIINNDKAVIEKEADTTVKVVEDLTKPVEDVSKQMEGHNDGKTFNIVV